MGAKRLRAQRGAVAFGKSRDDGTVGGIDFIIRQRAIGEAIADREGNADHALGDRRPGIAIKEGDGVNQIATGYAAIGQVVLAYYGLGQIGLGEFLWTISRRDGEAVRFFLSWWDYLKQFMR